MISQEGEHVGCGRRKVQPGERQEGKGCRWRLSWLKITEETGDCYVREREAEGAQTGTKDSLLVEGCAGQQRTPSDEWNERRVLEGEQGF